MDRAVNARAVAAVGERRIRERRAAQDEATKIKNQLVEDNAFLILENHALRMVIRDLRNYRINHSPPLGPRRNGPVKASTQGKGRGEPKEI